MAVVSSEMGPQNEEKKCIISEQIHEQAYLSKFQATKEDDLENKTINHALTTQKDKANTLRKEWVIDSGTSDPMTIDM